MREPRIERIKTSVYFTDANGVEWEVVDASRRGGRRWWRQYPGIDTAERRYFVRYSPINGANPRRAIEVRRYVFEPDDTRWFVEHVWQLQLEAATPRPTSLSPE